MFTDNLSEVNITEQMSSPEPPAARLFLFVVFVSLVSLQS